MANLSILCVTRGEPCVLDLLRKMRRDANTIEAQLVIACDRVDPMNIYAVGIAPDTTFEVQSSGYIESVLDASINQCHTDYILRLDDDESMSAGMVEWLRGGQYKSSPHWKFSRAHLYQNAATCIINPPLWPDHQTRLSTRGMSFGRTSIHCGSPFGGGELAPADVAIIHHKFLVKSVAQRQEIVDRYDSVSLGSGDCFKAFSLPERVYREDELNVVKLADLFCMSDE